jgi:hypothetical protein
MTVLLEPASGGVLEAVRYRVAVHQQASRHLC